VTCGTKQKAALWRFFVDFAQSFSGFLSASDYFNIANMFVKCLRCFSPRNYGEAIAKKNTLPARVWYFF